jgi:hypothetical protein
MTEALVYTFSTESDAPPLLRHIFGADTGILAVMTGKGYWAGDSYKLADTTNRFFSWPDQAKEAVDWLMAESDAGRDAYYCTHLLTDERRIKDNAAAISTLWVEADYGKVPPGIPQPTAVVESSPRRFYYFWKLTQPIDPQTAEQLNRRLTDAIGGDSGWALTKLLRLPGTRNYKYQDTPLVDLEDLSDRYYDPAWLDKTLPALEVAPTVTVDLDGPPVELSGYDLEVWEGKHPAIKDSRVDTSRTLYKIAATLYDNGLRNRPLLEAIRERDIALGFDKFADRLNGKDVERYQAIIANIMQKNPPAAEEETGSLFETAKEICESTPAKTDWQAYGFPRYSHVLVQGKIKEAGKTTAILEMIRACLKGDKFWGHPTQKIQAAVYVTEQTRTSFNKALWAAGLDDEENLYVLTRGKIAGKSWAEVVKIATDMAKEVGAEILVFDTFTKLAGLEDENDSAQIQKALTPLQNAAGDRLMLVFGHHERKAGGSVVDRGRGGSGFGGDVDQILSISRSNDKDIPDNVRVVEREGRFNDDMPEKTYVSLEADGYNLYDRDPQGKEVVYRSLPEHDEDGITQDEIAKKTGLNQGVVSRHIRALGDKVEQAGKQPGRGGAKLYRKAAP